VAASCGVSCAAPYKHFKNKDEFVLEIIRYIGNRWSMLEKQVMTIFENDKKKQIEELSLAYIKFWIANPNFRSILLLNPKQMDEEQKKAREHIDYQLKKTLRQITANGKRVLDIDSLPEADRVKVEELLQVIKKENEERGPRE
jgi:AcrR family transcriptional regulator